MRRAGFCDSDVSDCLPVRYSRYCIKTETASILISSPSDSPMMQASGEVWLVEKFSRGHPQRGQFVRVGWVQTGVICDFSNYKPPYLRNGTIYDQGYYWILIGNRISFGWPWTDLEWPLRVFFTSHICLSEPTTKIWMNIDPYYQRQKCKPKIAVSSSIRFIYYADIPWGSLGRGRQMRVGQVLWWFSNNTSQYLENGAFYRVGQKKPDCFWELITLRRLVVEMCVICQNLANFI